MVTNNIIYRNINVKNLKKMDEIRRSLQIMMGL